MGKIHLKNCLYLTNAELTAVADLSERSLLIAKKAGIEHIFKNYDDLLENPNVDAVIIALPTFLHTEAAIKAAKHGKSMMVEKPLARNVAEGAEIISATKRHGIKLMVGYPLRFSLPFVNLKNELDMGKLGDVQIALAELISTGPFFHRAEEMMPKPVPSWWFNKELTGGGALMDLGCHLVNLLKWYFGEIVDINSFLGYRFNLDFEDHATCVIKFKNETKATLNLGWFAEYHKLQVNLYGTVKHAFATSPSPSFLDYAKKIISARARDVSPVFYEELKYFANCLRLDITPLPSGEEGLEDLKVISQAYEKSFEKIKKTFGDCR